MITRTRKIFTLAGTVAALTMIPACSVDPDSGTDGRESDVTSDAGDATIAQSLGSIANLSTFAEAVSSAELGSVFDGQGSYTVLAPSDDAFEALGASRTALMAEDQRPVLIGIIRNHILPGHLTPENISAAIEAQDGEVSMKTLGDSVVIFKIDGETITASNGVGSVARLSDGSTEASNGVVIPLDAVLVPGKAGAD